MASKWTEEERDAVTAALDGGMTSREVAAEASAGRLEHEGRPLFAFELTAVQARGIAAGVRRKRPPADAAGRLDALVQRQLRLAEKQMRIIERAAEKADMRRYNALVVATGRIYETLGRADAYRKLAAPREFVADRSTSIVVAGAPVEGGDLLKAFRERVQNDERPLVPVPDVDDREVA